MWVLSYPPPRLGRKQASHLLFSCNMVKLVKCLSGIKVDTPSRCPNSVDLCLIPTGVWVPGLWLGILRKPNITQATGLCIRHWKTVCNSEGFKLLWIIILNPNGLQFVIVQWEHTLSLEVLTYSSFMLWMFCLLYVCYLKLWMICISSVSVCPLPSWMFWNTVKR